MIERQPNCDDNRPLAFGERVYRSFPAPLMHHLLHKPGVGYPTGMIEAIDGSTGIPAFDDEEFAALMVDMEAIRDNATEKLRALVAQRSIQSVT